MRSLILRLGLDSDSIRVAGITPSKRSALISKRWVVNAAAKRKLHGGTCGSRAVKHKPDMPTIPLAVAQLPAIAAISSLKDSPSLPTLAAAATPLVEARGVDEGDAVSDWLDGVPSDEEARQSKMEKWRQHPHFSVGIRMAELATFWFTSGLAIDKFPLFVSCMSNRFSDSVGDTNHSRNWVRHRPHPVHGIYLSGSPFVLVSETFSVADQGSNHAVRAWLKLCYFLECFCLWWLGLVHQVPTMSRIDC